MIRSLTLVAGILLMSRTLVFGIPALQLYIEGAIYDTASQTWAADFSSGNSIRLWAIGNTAGSGGVGALSGVKLAIAYDAADAGATHIEITPSTTKGYGGFTDVSVPVAPRFSAGVGAPGTVPKLGDGSNLPSHGIYGAGVAWSEYLLGDFDKSDSPSFDLAGLAGTSQTDIILGAAQKMQINVYDITISGTEAVHFDLYDHYQSRSAGQAKSKSVATFAPFSHDAEATEPISPSGKVNVPDASGTAILLALALVAVGGCSLRFRRTA